jgi:hypothetical protein
MDLGGWLRSLGLERYEAAFREHELDETVLPSLSHDTLKGLGVTAIRDRLKLLDVIAALRTDGSTQKDYADAAITSATPSAAPEDRERRPATVMFSDLVPQDVREVYFGYPQAHQASPLAEGERGS